MRRGLLGLGLAAGMLLGIQPLSAECDPCSEWSVGVHALYFAPITCPYTYASELTSSFSPEVNLQAGKARQVSCDADWGFRVFGNYLDGCLFAGLSYQWFEVANVDAVASESSIVIPGGFSITGGRVEGRDNIEYQNVDVRLGRYWLGGCGFRPYMYGNARWVDLSYRRALDAVDTTSALVQTFREKSQLRGGAIGIGFGGEADIGCNIGAFIEGNALGVIGRRSLKDIEYKGLFPTLSFVRQQFYPSGTCVIPEIDFRIGINYSYACGCWTLVAELGYEVDYFWQGVAFPELTGIAITNTEDFVTAVCEDIGFSGLFFGARVIF